MDIYCTGLARIRHQVTGTVYEISAEELDWDAVGSDERQMGPEVHFEATIEHAALGELKWGLWEYPVGVENYSKTEAGQHEVIEDFSYGLRHEKLDPNAWDDYSLPDDPLTIFDVSYRQTTNLLADHGSDGGDHVLNRMVFSHQITSLEAYLADTLIKEIRRDADAFQRLLNQDDDLAKEKFTLAEVSQGQALVERKVREHLRSIQYHNLAKVEVLYNIALGIQILKLTTEKASLFKAVKIRHDCVHRNGFDKDGKELRIFTRSFVQETADLIKAFVESIDAAVQGRRSGLDRAGPLS